MAKEAVGYLPGTDPGDMAANREAQMALQKLLASLDARQNSMFDPTLLALAEGFLKPTQTGSFGESLGYAAAGMRQAQEKELEREQKIAQARFELSQQGLALQRQKARERMFKQMIGGEGTPEPAEPAVSPSGAPAGPPSPVSAAGVAQGVAQAGAERLTQPAAGQGSLPAGGAPQGIRVGPGDPTFPTRDSFLRMQFLEGKSPTDAIKAWQDLRRSAEEVRDVGTYNRAEGMFYPNPSASEVERRIGQSTYVMPAAIAFQLDAAMLAKDTAKYNQIVQDFLGRSPKTKQQSDIDQASEVERAKILAQKSAQLEADAPKVRSTAVQINAAADRILSDINRYPEVFGVLEKPGVIFAFGKLIEEGLAVGTTRVNMAGFRQALTQADPNMSQEAIDALLRFAGNKAELELLFRKKYLSGEGQGAISNMEQAMIPNLIGSERDTPASLRDKATLLKLRSQFDQKEVAKWREMSKANPRLTYLQFLNSDEYAALQDRYEAALRAAFPQVYESTTRQPATSQPSGTVAPGAAVPALRPAPQVAPAAPQPAPQSSGAPAGAAPPATPRFQNATQRLNSIGIR